MSGYEVAELIRQRDRETELRRAAEEHNAALRVALEQKPYIDEWLTLVEERDELLAALKAAEGHLADDLNNTALHPVRQCPVLDVVRAAIAKATTPGHSPAVVVAPSTAANSQNQDAAATTSPLHQDPRHD